MPLSNDFKAKIREGKVKEALEMALAEAVELKITTWVAQESEGNGSGLASEAGSPGQRLETRINLLSNEIATEVGEQYIDGGVYSQLKVFHQEQVNQSHRLIQNNINCLQRLLSLWGRLDPAIAASIPVQESLIPSQPLLIDDEDAGFANGTNALPASIPTVASSVVETPLISIPQPDAVEVIPQPVSENAPFDRSSLFEDEYQPQAVELESIAEAETPIVSTPEDTLKTNSGTNIAGVAGVAAVAGIGMAGMNLYNSFRQDDEAVDSQPEVSESESLFGTEVESSVTQSAELFSDRAEADSFDAFSNDFQPESSESESLFGTEVESSATPSAELFSDRAEADSFDAFSNPTIESGDASETPENIISSGWGEETWSQSDIPEIQDFGTADASSSNEVSLLNWEDGIPAPVMGGLGTAEIVPPVTDNLASSWEAESDALDLGTAGIVPPTEDNTSASAWGEETWSQSDILEIQDLNPTDSLAENEMGAVSWDEQSFASIPEAEAAPLTGDLSFSNWEESATPELEMGETATPNLDDLDGSSWELGLPAPEAEAARLTDDLSFSNWEESATPELEGEIATPSLDNLTASNWSEETWSQDDIADTQNLVAADAPSAPNDSLNLFGSEEVEGLDTVESFDDIATPEVDIFAEGGEEELDAIAPDTLSEAIAPESVNETSDADFNIPGAAVLGGIGVAGIGLFATQGGEERVTLEAPQNEVSEAPEADTELPSTISSLDELAFTDTFVQAESSLGAEATPELWVSPTLENLDVAQTPENLEFDALNTPQLGLEGEAPEANLASWDLEGQFSSEPELETVSQSQAPVEAPEADINSWNLGEPLGLDSEISEPELETVSQAPVEAPEADINSWNLGELDLDAGISEADLEMLSQAPVEAPEADIDSWNLGEPLSLDSGISEPELETVSQAPVEAPEADINSWNLGELDLDADISEADLEMLSQAPVEAPEASIDSWNLGSSVEIGATEREISQWGLADSSQVSAESINFSSEADLASWTNEDLSLNSGWDAASLDLELPADAIDGLSDEADLFGEPASAAEIDDALAGDLKSWAMPSSSLETEAPEKLDDIIGDPEMAMDDLNLSTPEIWDNWEDENVREDSIAALDRLSNDNNPLDLGNLDAGADWELPLDADNMADPFADSGLNGLEDWQLIAPEASPSAVNNASEDLDLFLNSPESGKFPTDSKNPNSPDALSLDEDLSLWGSEDDPFADIFSVESPESKEKQK